MKNKARLSIEWLSGCSGCEVGIVDLHEKLLTVLEELTIVRCPILLDTKEYVAAEIGILTGSVRTEHDRAAAEKMRQKCEAIIAFGTCAVYGGPQGASWAHANTDLLDNSYRHSESTETSSLPAHVPELLPEILPLDAVIEVDLYLPGCPPHAAYIHEGLMALLRGKEPGIGHHTVCFHCTRNMKKTSTTTLKRLHECETPSDLCFLSQGILCFGSVTLDRCQAPCPRNAIPCFSCGGPAETIILEPQKDVRTEIAARMAALTDIPRDVILREIEAQAKTHFAYAMGSPVFRQKPTFLLKKWLREHADKEQK